MLRSGIMYPSYVIHLTSPMSCHPFHVTLFMSPFHITHLGLPEVSVSQYCISGYSYTFHGTQQPHLSHSFGLPGPPFLATTKGL
jgi:hypothetical protein